MEVFEGVGNEARSHAIGGMHSERVFKKSQRFPTSSQGCWGGGWTRSLDDIVRMWLSV